MGGGGLDQAAEVDLRPRVLGTAAVGHGNKWRRQPELDLRAPMAAAVEE